MPHPKNSRATSTHHKDEKDEARRLRLNDVGARLNKMSPQHEKALHSGAAIGTKRQSIGRALRLGTDLVAGVAVGGLIGFWLDRWFDTSPLCFILFFLLGTAAGFLNVFRTAKEIQEEQAMLIKQGKLDLGQDLVDEDED